MRGKARIEVVFIEFTVRFGSDKKISLKASTRSQFISKHILQRPEDQHEDSLGSDWRTLMDGQLSMFLMD